MNGYQGTLELFDPALDPLTPYNVWVDINNGPNPVDQSSTGDTYSIHVQKASGGPRTTIAQDYLADRDPVGLADTGFTQPNLDSLAIIGRATHSTTQNLLFDDLYLSKDGFNATVPRPFGFTEPVASQPPSLSIQPAGTQVQITWAGGTLQSADTVTGAWGDLNGLTSPALIPAAGVGSAKFYRVRQ